MWILVIVHLLVVAALVFPIWKNERRLSKVLWPALVAKLGGGVALGLVYSYYYGVGDTFIYFEDAKVLAALARRDPWAYLNFLWNNEGESWPGLAFEDPRAVFLVKIVSMANLITFDNYWATSFYFSLLSFLSGWWLVKTIDRYDQRASLPAVIAFLFLPSVVFWSAGLIKESLAMTGLCFLFAVFTRWWFGGSQRWWYWIGGFVAAWVVWNLKYYFAAVFFPVAAATVLYRYASNYLSRVRGFGYEVALWLSVFVALTLIATQLHPNLYPSRFLNVLVENNRAFQLLSADEDLIHFHNLTSEPVSILINAPWAVVSGLFRPFIWEADTVFQFLIGAENLFVMALILVAVPELRRLPASPNRVLIVAIIAYCLLSCVFIALSTPNFGTLSRYRVGYLPFLVFLALCSPRLLRLLQRKAGDLVLNQR